MAITLFGIKNCDTIKKARKYLDSSGVDYVFHDYRVDGVDAKVVQAWVDTHGWEVILNKRGTTWRKIDEATKAATNNDNAAALLCDQPAMIKRPVLTIGKKSLVGFSKENYDQVLKEHG